MEEVKCGGGILASSREQHIKRSKRRNRIRGRRELRKNGWSEQRGILAEGLNVGRRKVEEENGKRPGSNVFENEAGEGKSSEKE